LFWGIEMGIEAAGMGLPWLGVVVSKKAEIDRCDGVDGHV